METRTILQIVLGVVITLSVGLGGFMAYQLTREAETVVVETIVEQGGEAEEIINPWSTKSDAAVLLVKRIRVDGPADPSAKNGKDDDAEELTVGQLLADEKWVKDKLKITGEPRGWQGEWWGETKYGPHYYLVRYAFQDESITLGPEWLVDLKGQKVVAKNLPARVVENPTEGIKSELYDKNQAIVSAIASHRFDSGMSLAGALLLYFEKRSDVEADDTIIGWTIDHEQGDLFKAYFQWIEKKEPTYAEFEFDYKRKALKAVNLQAANIMRIGEDFERERVSIMPASYDPKARGSDKWKGAARKQCRDPRHRSRCKALATVLDEAAVVESLEWLLTARANTAEDFENCKSERRCAWIPEFKGEGKYNVKYRYQLEGDKEESVSWDIELKKGEIAPVDRVGKLAFSVIRPR